MDAVEIADALRAEAEQIVVGRGIDAILQSHGDVLYTGSYALGTMAWPDVDVDMTLQPDPVSLDAVFEMARELASVEGVFKVQFDNFRIRRLEPFPVGYYLGLRVRRTDWNDFLKVDIWMTGPEHMARTRAWTKRVSDAMNEDARRLIVEIKQSLLTPEGRTPEGSGYHICEGVLFNGLRTVAEARRYLRDRGVEGV